MSFGIDKELTMGTRLLCSMPQARHSPSSSSWVHANSTMNNVLPRIERLKTRYGINLCMADAVKSGTNPLAPCSKPSDDTRGLVKICGSILDKSNVLQACTSFIIFKCIPQLLYFPSPSVCYYSASSQIECMHAFWAMSDLHRGMCPHR